MTGLAVGFVWLFSPTPASACSCGWIGPPCQAAWNADVIFIGVARSVEPMDSNESGPMRVTFDVQRAFVNADSRRLEVFTARSGAACGVHFVAGMAYLVYAQRAETGELRASRCSRTRAVTRAEEDIRFLENLPHLPNGARVYGEIRHAQREPWEDWAVDYGPLEGLVVSVRGAGFYRETATNASGLYEIRGLPFGPATVAVGAPPGYSQRYLERQVDLKDPRACNQQDFELRLSGRAAGLVVDAAGQPVAGAKVDAVAAELAGYSPPPYQEPATTDESGRFVFDELPPGDYVFGVGLTRYPSPAAPQTWWPQAKKETPGTSAARVESGRSVEVGVLRFSNR